MVSLRFGIPIQDGVARSQIVYQSPGRWFAVRLLKLMVAYITLHYHIEPLAQRPKNFAFGDANIPSFTTKIRVRRRKAG